MRPREMPGITPTMRAGGITVSPRLVCTVLLGMAIWHAMATQCRAEGVTLTPSKESYEVGEPVLVTLENGTSTTIVLYSFPGWYVFDPDSTRVAPCAILPLEHDLGPGGSLHFDWDQRNCEDDQVPIGTYRARVSYFVDDRPALLSETVEAFFGIGVTPIAPSTWSQVKLLFR